MNDFEFKKYLKKFMSEDTIIDNYPDGMTQQELADELGTSRANVQQIERRIRNIIRKALFDRYGVSKLEDIL
jgi:hypothetical protein